MAAHRRPHQRRLLARLQLHALVVQQLLHDGHVAGLGGVEQRRVPLAVDGVDIRATEQQLPDDEQAAVQDGQVQRRHACHTYTRTEARASISSSRERLRMKSPPPHRHLWPPPGCRGAAAAPTLPAAAASPRAV